MLPTISAWISLDLSVWCLRRAWRNAPRAQESRVDSRTRSSAKFRRREQTPSSSPLSSSSTLLASLANHTQTELCHIEWTHPIIENRCVVLSSICHVAHVCIDHQSKTWAMIMLMETMMPSTTKPQTPTRIHENKGDKHNYYVYALKFYKQFRTKISLRWKRYASMLSYAINAALLPGNRALHGHMHRFTSCSSFSSLISHCTVKIV